MPPSTPRSKPTVDPHTPVDAPKNPRAIPPQPPSPRSDEERIDEAVRESFPASDPPAHGGHGASGLGDHTARGTHAPDRA